VDRAVTILVAHPEALYRPNPRHGQCRWLGCDEAPTDLAGPWCWRHRAWHYARVRIREDMRRAVLREVGTLAQLGLIRSEYV
jgi:hypothetical protein